MAPSVPSSARSRMRSASRSARIAAIAASARQQQGDRPERSERRERPGRDEDAYDLPPVEQSTTSLAGLFAAAMANAEKKDEE